MAIRKWLEQNPEVLLIAAAAHLLVVAAGAARIGVRGSSLAGRFFEIYAVYSGAENSYGFFAPGVASEWRATLDWYDPAGRNWTTLTRPVANIELAVLDSTINSHFAREDLREVLAASWASSGMAQTQRAAAVVVRAETFMLPTMEQYRQGARGRWQTFAAYAFTTADRMRLVDSEDRRAASR